MFCNTALCISAKEGFPALFSPGCGQDLWPNLLLFCPLHSSEKRCRWERASCPGFLPFRPSWPVYCSYSKCLCLLFLQRGCGTDTTAGCFMRALWFHVMHLLYLRVKSIKGKIFKNNLPPAPERRGALSPLLSEMFCGVVMAFSAGEGAGNLFGGLVVGDGGSITASSASSAPRASSADRNQEQLPRLRRGECSRRALLSQWCLVCASNGPWCARGEQGWRAQLGLSCCG